MTAWSSAVMVGTGLWGILILGAAFVVVLSAFYLPLQLFASGIAGLISALSAIAIALGLLAETIGGSFDISKEFGTLLGSFGLLFIAGLAVIRTRHRPSET